MKILYVLDQYPVTSQTFVSNEISEIRKMGHSVTVVTLRTSKLSSHADYDLQGSLLRIPVDHVAAFLKDPGKYFIYLYKLMKMRGADFPWCLLVPALVRVLKVERPDYVHTHFALRSAGLLQLSQSLQNARWGVTTHAYDIYVRNKAIKIKLRNCHVATISERNKVELMDRFNIEVNSVIHCGVDTEKMRTIVREKPTSNFSVVAIGRCVEKKGFAVLLDAVAILKNSGHEIKCQIIGEGPTLNALKERSNALGVGDLVDFIGAASHDDCLKFMAMSSCVAVPAVVAADGDVDGIPVVILEAMALGVPVIASDVGSISEVISDDTGWLVTPGKPKALAEIISGLQRGVLNEQSRIDNAKNAISSTRTLSQQAMGVLNAARDSNYSTQGAI